MCSACPAEKASNETTFSNTASGSSTTTSVGSAVTESQYMKPATIRKLNTISGAPSLAAPARDFNVAILPYPCRLSSLRSEARTASLTEPDSITPTR